MTNTPECESKGNGDITPEQQVEIAFLMDAFKQGLARCLKVPKVYVVMLVHEPQACMLHSPPHLLTNCPFAGVPAILQNGLLSVLTRADRAVKIDATPPTGKGH